jgi:hypothetical protein
MKGYVLLDTLYIHVKYPNRDVFDNWYEPIKNVDSRILRQGIATENFTVRGGSAGYKISLWQHDARIFLTDQVDQKCGEGMGMGIWVQLGPKFIIQEMNNLHRAVQDLLSQAGVKGTYPMSITRLDIAVDLFDVSMQDQDVITWSENWVGRSKLSGVFYNSRSATLETFYIGSRKSPVFLRIYDKVAQSKAEGDYPYWRDVWGGYEGNVTRIEWEIKPKDGNFPNEITDFSKFNGFSVRELLAYLIDWGRLCIPGEEGSKRCRWEDDLFWKNLRGVIFDWGDGMHMPTSRLGKKYKGLSDQYIKFLSGTISGGMAKLTPENPKFFDMIEGLNLRGETLEKINEKAELKAKILKNL